MAPRPRRRRADGRLDSGRAAGRGEPVLGLRRQVLAGVLLRRGVPDLAREHAVPGFILRLDGAHPDWKWSAGEGIVRVRHTGSLDRPARGRKWASADETRANLTCDECSAGCLPPWRPRS